MQFTLKPLKNNPHTKFYEHVLMETPDGEPVAVLHIETTFFQSGDGPGAKGAKTLQNGATRTFTGTFD